MATKTFLPSPNRPPSRFTPAVAITLIHSFTFLLVRLTTLLRFEVNSFHCIATLHLKLTISAVLHRLDRLTSCVLLFSTSNETANKITDEIKQQKANKTYWALTYGILSTTIGYFPLFVLVLSFAHMWQGGNHCRPSCLVRSHRGKCWPG